MKNLKHFLAIFLIIPLMITAQDTLNYPTDVVYDEAAETYYVSNWADGDGYILTLNTFGEITGTLFSDLDYPEGLCLIDNVLYVTDNGDLYGGNAPSYLVGIDIFSGNELLKVEIAAETTNLDLMTTDNNGNLYICDSEKLLIYKYEIATATITVFVEGVNKPLGICYDEIEDRIIFTESKSNISYLKAIDPDGSNMSNVFYHLGWIEGIVMDDEGNYFMSSWSGSNDTLWGYEPVFKLSHGLNWKYELTGDQNRPFGMCMGHDNHLVICNWGSHVVNFLNLEPFGTEENILSNNNLTVYPNPGNGDFNLHLPEIQSQVANLTVLDLNGRIITSNIIRKAEAEFEQSLDLTFLPVGIYILKVQDGNQVYHKKLVVKSVRP